MTTATWDGVAARVVALASTAVPPAGEPVAALREEFKFVVELLT